MADFGFLVHPLSLDDVYRKYSFAKKVSPKLVKSLLRRRPPFAIGEMKGIVSETGRSVKGVIVAVPFLPEQFYELEEKKVLKKIARGVRVAAEEGAKIVGLGAFTAIPGNGGLDLKGKVTIPVTTGNTYTVAIAMDSVLEGLKVMDRNPKESVLAVFGATGSIGRTVSIILSREFKKSILVGRSMEKLEDVAREALENGEGEVETTTYLAKIKEADALVAVSSAVDAVIEPEMLKPGAVVCDVARPRDVSASVVKKRSDVLVIDGGVVSVPGSFHSTFKFGLPSGKALACMAETMILTLEERYEYFTLGKEITPEKVEEIRKLALKHGFQLGGFRSFEKELSMVKIEEIKQNAKMALKIS